MNANNQTTCLANEAKLFSPIEMRKCAFILHPLLSFIRKLIIALTPIFYHLTPNFQLLTSNS